MKPDRSESNHEMIHLSLTTIYLPRNSSEQDYPPCTSTGRILQLCKFHQYQFICYGVVGLTRIMERWMDRQTG